MDRPIFDNERASSRAWADGGAEAERAEKERHARAQRDHEKGQMAAFRAWQAEKRARKGGLRELRRADWLAEVDP